MKLKTKRCYVILAMAVFLSTVLFGGAKDVEAAKKPQYKISGQTITVKAKRNSDITENLDSALKAARDKAKDTKIMTVVVPKGTYKINEKGLHIYSNTTLDLSSGVTLKYSGKKSHPMLMTGINGKYKNRKDYNNSSLCKKYNGFKNITIKGGTWISKKSNKSNTMRLFHAKNITLDGVTLSGGGGVHLVEAAAINGFYVRNCTFKDYGTNNKNNSLKLEALQMDIPCSEDVYPSTYEDGTVMKNVEISGCTFSNVPRGVGTHTLLNGAYFTNIKINNNTFKDVWEEAIIGLNYADCEIRDNTITNCGGGILFQYFKARPESIATTIFDGKKKYKGKIRHDANTVISNNSITIKYTKESDEVQGIKLYGFNLTSAVNGRDGKKIPKGDYYLSGVTVEHNQITTAGYGIHLMDTKNCTIRNNSIKGQDVSSSDSRKDKYNGIMLEDTSENIAVSSNIIDGMVSNGILIQESSSVNALENSQISNCKKAGINFYDKSSASCDIKDNQISDCGTNGIVLNGHCKVNKAILGNTIRNVDKGICVIDHSTVSGSITDNSMTGVRRELYIDDTSSAF